MSNPDEPEAEPDEDEWDLAETMPLQMEEGEEMETLKVTGEEPDRN